MIHKQKTLFSGIQPSGILTIGNYIGAIRQWLEMQNEYNCLFSLVDMHVITVRQDPKLFRQQTLDVFALYLACGLDPNKSIIFAQSHVSAHSELAWILNCITNHGELSRMTQFKDKSQRHSDNVNVGLFAYPVLMAADILLYQSDIVPVGDDQKQHLELARNLAQRFNHHFGETFVVPEPMIPKQAEGGRIMSLQDPEKKMSKSDANQGAYINLLDEPNKIRKKFKRAVTDSDNEIRFAEDKPGISNLLTIYSAFTNKAISDIEKEYEGKGYGALKTDVGDTVADFLEPIQQKFAEIRPDETQLLKMLHEAATKADKLARPTLNKVMDAIGFLPRG